MTVDWSALLNAQCNEDRESAEVAMALEAASPGITDRIATAALAGIHPHTSAGDIEYGTERVPLIRADIEDLERARDELVCQRFSEFLRRDMRDRRYDRSLKIGRPLKDDQTEKIIAALQRKLTRSRVESFTRFVSMSAVHSRSDRSWRDAVGAGQIPADEVRRYWVAARDERDCERCRQMYELNPHGRGLDEPFTLASGGTIMMPPLCPKCRCTVWIRRERKGIRRGSAPGGPVLKLVPLDRHRA